MAAPQPRHGSFPLPDFKRMADGVTGGRSLREGYQRGWGIEFGGLAQKIEQETLYREADAAGEGTLMAREKRLNMYLLLTRFLGKLSSQNIVEFGTYRGGGALFMATVLKELYPQAKLFALDTFEGMPPVDKERDLHAKGDFRDALLPEFRRRAEALKLDNIVIVQGLFEETFPSLKEHQFGVAHIDCDIYPAVMYCQEAVWPQMAKGGYLVYDDAGVSSCIGATEAVENLIMERRIHTEQVWPHWIVRAGLEA